MIQIVFLSLVFLLQAGFDSARIHKHVLSATYEGLWVKRLNLQAEGGSKYLLGNGLAVRGASNELWFFYEFKPDDGPMIQRFESRKEGAKVRITYDPSCFYILSITDLNPPAPLPTPSPSPETYSYVSKTWPSSAAARVKLLNDMGAEGYRLAQVISTTAYFEKKK